MTFAPPCICPDLLMLLAVLLVYSVIQCNSLLEHPISFLVCYNVHYMRCLHGLHFRQAKHICLSFGYTRTLSLELVATQTYLCMVKAVRVDRYLAVYRNRRILIH
jgi:hypothetical protein